MEQMELNANTIECLKMIVIKRGGSQMKKIRNKRGLIYRRMNRIRSISCKKLKKNKFF